MVWVIVGKVFGMVFCETSGRIPTSNKEVGCLTSPLCRWLLDVCGPAGLLRIFGKRSILSLSGSFLHGLGVDPGPAFTTNPAFRVAVEFGPPVFRDEMSFDTIWSGPPASTGELQICFWKPRTTIQRALLELGVRSLIGLFLVNLCF